MKNLTLIRHAKSSWKYPELSDFDRPLNKRGKKNAPYMGERLAKLKIFPDRIITSPAARALATAKMIAKAIKYPSKQLIADQRVYLSSARELLSVIREVDDSCKEVFLIGHNPSITDLANNLSYESIENIPTTGVARVRFDLDTWEQVSDGTGKLVLFDYPKKKRSED